MLKYLENSEYLVDHLDVAALTPGERTLFYKLILSVADNVPSTEAYAVLPIKEALPFLTIKNNNTEAALMKFGRKVLSCGLMNANSRHFELLFQQFDLSDRNVCVAAFGETAVRSCMKLKKEVALLSDDSGMENYSGLKHPVSKLLYRMCMENEDIGSFRLTMDDLRRMMGYSGSECTASVLNRYLVPAINEMYAYRENVRYTKFAVGEGDKPARLNATTGIEVTFGKRRHT